MTDKYNKGKQNLEVDLTMHVYVSSAECRTNSHCKESFENVVLFKCWGNDTNKSKLQAQGMGM